MKKCIKLLFLCGILMMVHSWAEGQAIVTHQLTMWTTGQLPLWDGNSIRYYGFANGYLTPPQFPAPILYANEGDSVIVNVRNQSQGAHHTIHWHGLDVDQANDGVPHLSFSLYHEQDTFYAFRVPHAGTFLYHCHVASIVHVQMGMYGNFIVRPADGSNRFWTGGPAFDKDINWMVSDFDKSWHDTIPVHSTMDSAWAVFPIPPYIPDYFLINGKAEQQLADPGTAIEARREEKVNLRVSDMGFLQVFLRIPAALNPTVMVSDGRPLPTPFSGDTLRILPGERYEIQLEAFSEFQDSIEVTWLDMNNDSLWGTQYVPVTIMGHIGVEEPVQPEGFLSVSPNPGNGYCYLNWSLPEPAQGTLQVVDMQGKTLQSDSQWFTIRGGKSLDLSGLPAGTYFVRCSTPKWEGSTTVVIQH